MPRIVEVRGAAIGTKAHGAAIGEPNVVNTGGARAIDGTLARRNVILRNTGVKGRCAAVWSSTGQALGSRSAAGGQGYMRRITPMFQRAVRWVADGTDWAGPGRCCAERLVLVGRSDRCR